MLLLIAMILVGGSAWADEVTFTFKTDKDITYTQTGTSGGGAKCIVSKSNVTLSGTNAYTDAEKSLSVYAKSTLTITAPGNISKIELVYNGKVYPFDEAVGNGTKGSKFTASGSNPATYTLADPSASVTLSNPNGGKTELLSLKVTYVAGAVVDVTGVSLSETSKTIMATEKFTLTATVAPADATNKLVKWSSDDETIAKVVDGVVTGLKAGTATITVTTADGSKTASCEVTVVAKEKPAGAVFYESFDGCDGYGGNDGAWGSISQTKDFHNADNDGWTIAGSIMSGSQCASIRKVDASTPSSLTTPAIGVAGNGKVVFNAEAWGTDTGDFYVTLVGGGTFVEGTPNLSNKSTTSKVALQKKGAWKTYTLEFEGFTADSKIKFEAPANKRVFLDEVVVYVDASDEPAYTPATLTLTAEDAGAYYATFSSDKVTFFPEDYIVSAVGVENGKLYQFDNEEAFDEDIVEINGEDVIGYYVPANTGVLITSLESTVTYYTAEGVTPSNDVDAVNMLRPASASMTGDYKFYKLAYDDYSAKTDLGFYYGAENGAAFTCKAGLAYLAVPAESAVKSFALNPSATAIQSVNATASASAIYNLAGQRLSQPQKGINIVDGKKVLVK